jgi:hypothetical protein
VKSPGKLPKVPSILKEPSPKQLEQERAGREKEFKKNFYLLPLSHAINNE